MAVTLDDIYKKVLDLNLYIDNLPTRLLVRAGQIVIYSGLSDISESLGIIRAGEFRAGNNADPNGGFSGMRMIYPPAVYNSELWNLVGVNNDVMQFGVRASDGKLIAGGGNVVLDSSGVTAIAGNIAGWQIQSNRLTNSNLSLYSTGSLQTNDFAGGVFGRGWRIASDGSAEFNNAFIRGELRTSVLTYQEVQAVGGTLAVFKSAGSLKSEATVTSGSFTIDITDPPSEHVQIFAVNDRLRIKTGTYDSWFNVAGITDMTTHFRYTCSFVSGSQVTYPAGTAVVNYGQSGQGLIEISTIGNSAPFISLGTHAGSPQSSITQHLRIGNLNGSFGITGNQYGIGIGQYADNQAYLVYTPQSGLRIKGKIVAEGGAIPELRESFDYDNIDQFHARVYYWGSGKSITTLETDTGSVSGNKVLKCGNGTTALTVMFVLGTPIPYNPEKLYRMSVRVRRTAGAGVLYAGIAGFDSNLNPCNSAGQSDYGNQYFVAGAGVHPSSTWTTYVGYLKGYGTPFVPAPNPANPSPAHSNVRFIAPIFFVNFQDIAGITYLDEIRLEEIPDAITADRIYSGTLQIGTKLTIGQIANNKGRLELEVLSNGNATLKGIYRNNSGVDTTEAYFGSDGKFYAGGGNVRLDRDGIRLVESAGFNLDNAINFFSPTEASIYYTTAGIGFNNLVFTNRQIEDLLHSSVLTAVEPVNYESMVTLEARSPTGGISRFVVYSKNGQPRKLRSLGVDLWLESGATIRESTAIAARVIRTSAQSIPNAAWTAISFSQATFDDRPLGLSAHWDGGTRLYCRVAGTYLITGNVAWAVNATGARRMAIRVNGTAPFYAIVDGRPYDTSTNQVNWIELSTIIKLNVGDYVELIVFQTSGGNLDVPYATPHHVPNLTMARIA